MKKSLSGVLVLFTMMSANAMAGPISGSWTCKDNETVRFEMRIDESMQSVTMKSLDKDDPREFTSEFEILPLNESPIEINTDLAVETRTKMGVVRVQLGQEGDSPILLMANLNGTLFIGEDGRAKFLIGDILGFYPHLFCDLKK